MASEFVHNPDSLPGYEVELSYTEGEEASEFGHNPHSLPGYEPEEVVISYPEGEWIEGVYCQYFGRIYRSGVLELEDCTVLDPLSFNDSDDESDVEILEPPSPVPVNIEVIDIEDDPKPNQPNQKKEITKLSIVSYDDDSSSFSDEKNAVEKEQKKDCMRKAIKKELAEDYNNKTTTKEHEETSKQKSLKKDHQVSHSKKAINKEVHVKRSTKKEREERHSRKVKSRSRRDYVERYQSGSDSSETDDANYTRKVKSRSKRDYREKNQSHSDSSERYDANYSRKVKSRFKRDYIDKNQSHSDSSEKHAANYSRKVKSRSKRDYLEKNQSLSDSSEKNDANYSKKVKSRSKRDYIEKNQSHSDSSGKSSYRKRDQSKKRSYSPLSETHEKRKVYKNRFSRSPSPQFYDHKISKKKYSRSPSPQYYDDHKISKKKYSRSPSPQNYDDHKISKKKYSRSPSPQYYDDHKISKKKYSRSPSPEYYADHKVSIKKYSHSPPPSECKVKEEPGEILKPDHLFGSYPCKECNIVMNSFNTYQTHIHGKRHLKNLRMKGQLKPGEAVSKVEPPVPKEIREGMPKYPLPPVGIVRKKVNDRATMQETVEKLGLICPGLEKVYEIQGITELSYYCSFCDSVCSTNSILPHLKGYKHQLRSLKHFDPSTYDRISYRPKWDIESSIFDILKKTQFKEGLGKMTVERDEFVCDPKDIGNIDAVPSTSRGIPGTSREVIGFTDYERTTIPDQSKSDFYCKICQSHMNSEAMWQSHIRGKRHLANIKKHPGDRPSKTRTIPLPNATPHLYKLIKNIEEPIIGLDQVTEIQIPETGSSNYQCYLCGGSCSQCDIVEHLISVKHMLKYLEHLKYTGLEVLEGMRGHAFNTLVIGMARNVFREEGRGKPSVHVTKSSIRP